MDTTTIVAIVVIAALVLLVVGGLAWLARKQQSDRLRESFGSEYDHAVSEAGGRREAERELAQRQDRVERLHIKTLTHEQCNAYMEEWQGVQAHFVDEPRSALHDADGLVSKVMEERGYPVGDFEQRAADISVDHPQVVTTYRLAHNISRASDQNNATTEEMRQAMQSYRALFDDLLQTAEARR